MKNTYNLCGDGYPHTVVPVDPNTPCPGTIQNVQIFKCTKCGAFFEKEKRKK